MSKVLTLADLRGNGIHFLLDFSVAGQTIQLAEQPLSTPWGDYHDGLKWGGELPDILKLLARQPESKRASMTLHVWPHLDVSDLVSKGHSLGAATGQLYIWPEGADHRVTLIDGTVKEPIWDLPERPITTTLEEDPVDDQGKIPDVEARVTDDTWPDHDPNVEGEYYPIVIGAPSQYSKAGFFGYGRSTPALIIEVGDPQAGTPDNGKILIAGHRVLASQVLVSHEESGLVMVSATVTHEKDGLGRTCAVVDMNQGAGSFYVSEGDAIWVDWSRTLNRYAHPGYQSGEALRGAGDLVTWFMERSTIRWDRGRMAAIAPQLNTYKIDTFIMAADDRITPSHWVRDNVLKYLPVSPKIGPDGWYLVLWKYNATADEAVAHIEQGLNADRSGDIETSPLDKVENEIEILYMNRPAAKRYSERRVLTGDEETRRRDPDAYPSLFATRSRDQYGLRIGKPIMAKHVQDDSTAARILDWMIQHKGTQRYSLGYDVEKEVAGPLETGSVITLTDEARGFDTRLGLVTEKYPSKSGYWLVRLEIPAIDVGVPG